MGSVALFLFFLLIFGAIFPWTALFDIHLQFGVVYSLLDPAIAILCIILPFSLCLLLYHQKHAAFLRKTYLITSKLKSRNTRKVVYFSGTRNEANIYFDQLDALWK
ncbi:unnamed protein product [Caenorhabditis angaria]|uniref:Uncharacterized protein n=1 Tax=Caenorhabditis angaria TaxID=860376 RepID=A0A9P1IX76_9PELO|nr:unnamed protein product [Caenorhabditis angaria]